jgi:signal transduction histidine kinase
VAAVFGTLMLSRRRVSQPVLGLAAALGTAVITLATLEGGHMTGTEDNEVLFLWVSLFAFWFFDLRHALIQLGLIGAADAILLIDQHPTFADAVTRWVVLVATLFVTGMLMAWIRRSLEREREETAHLAVVAERMRIARDLHDAAGHGVTAVSLQAATGIRAIDDGADVGEARAVLEEIKRTPGSRSRTCASCSDCCVPAMRPTRSAIESASRIST